MKFEYKIIRSKRKTLGLEVSPNGILVRAPYYVTKYDIENFIDEHEDWIQKHIKLCEERQAQAASVEKLTDYEIRELADKALAYIPERVLYYAPLVGVTYGCITIRNQKTKWGSCSSKGNLNFNCLLMLTPPEVIDSIVVHELCHRKYMDHSKEFYSEVYRVYPEYDKWHKWLDDNGAAIMARMY